MISVTMVTKKGKAKENDTAIHEMLWHSMTISTAFFFRSIYGLTDTDLIILELIMVLQIQAWHY